MSNKTQLPDEVTAAINKFIEAKIAAEREYWDKPASDSDRAKTYVWGYGKGIKAGATEYATRLHEAQQENEHLRRWKMEAAELLTKINAYAHKHLEIKLGECAVDFVVAQAKERDELKRENDRLKIALENVYNIHSDQWTEYDRKVIKDLIKKEGESNTPDRGDGQATISKCGNCGSEGSNQYIGNQYYLCDACMQSPENI